MRSLRGEARPAWSIAAEAAFINLRLSMTHGRIAACVI